MVQSVPRARTQGKAASPTLPPRVPLCPEARAAARSLYLGTAAMLVCLETPCTASPPWAYVPRSLWPGPRSPVQGLGVACPGREN